MLHKADSRDTREKMPLGALGCASSILTINISNQPPPRHPSPTRAQAKWVGTSAKERAAMLRVAMRLFVDAAKRMSEVSVAAKGSWGNGLGEEWWVAPAVSQRSNVTWPKRSRGGWCAPCLLLT